MERSRIAIVIPALNEAATIGAVLLKVKEYGLPIVVDDGSTDATASIAASAGAEVVSHAINLGYDQALNSGFARAAKLDCAYVITIDADGQHNPVQLQEMIGYLDQDVELVLGVRDRHQRIGEVIYSWCAKRMWRISDPLCGMKGYSIRLYNQIGHFDQLRSIGSELAVRSVVRGCKVQEMKVITSNREDAPRFGRRLGANYKIIRAMLVLAYLHFTHRLMK